MKAPRDSYFDNVKLILIVFVVVGHIIEPLIGASHSLKSLYLFLYFFHMPLFVFISGYFTKNISSGNYAHNIISRLVVPYFIFESLYTIIDYCLFEQKAMAFSYFTPYWIMWFLFSMILWKVILPYIIKMRFALAVSFIMAVLVGYANDVSYYFSLSRTFVFFPFFLAGYYFDKRHLDKLLTMPARILSAVVLVSVFVSVYYCGQELKPQWLYGSYSFESLKHNEWYAGIYRIGIFVLTFIMSACVLALTPRRTIPFISNMGGRTIYVYLLHGFIMKYLIYLDVYKRLNTSYEKVFLILSGVVLVMIVSTPFIPTMFKVIVNPRMAGILKPSEQEAMR